MKRKIRIISLSKIDSTNTYLKNLAESGADEGVIVTALEQTNGRGRHGKPFYSPKDTGLYMSILIRPDFSVTESLFITSMTAVALARAIESVCDKKCGIKWVNDIYVDEKKVAGILSEGSFDYTNDKVNYVIVGIGVNLTTNDFPEELRDIATSIGQENVKERLTESIIEEFFKLYDSFNNHSFLDEYKNRSILIGKRVSIVGADKQTGVVTDIDSTCRLIIENDCGEKKALSSGEVSVKIIK